MQCLLRQNKLLIASCVFHKIHDSQHCILLGDALCALQGNCIPHRQIHVMQQIHQVLAVARDQNPIFLKKRIIVHDAILHQIPLLIKRHLLPCQSAHRIPVRRVGRLRRSTKYHRPCMNAIDLWQRQNLRAHLFAQRPFLLFLCQKFRFVNFHCVVAAIPETIACHLLRIHGICIGCNTRCQNACHSKRHQCQQHLSAVARKVQAGKAEHG